MIRVLAVVLIWASSLLRSQTPLRERFSVTATPKGPNQINLRWSPVSTPIDGYLIEIQSDMDTRYSSFTELQPIPKATGYTCNSTVQRNGGFCNISDPTGAHVYNPQSNGIPYWATDATYIDPQDSSPAQFIAWGLRPNTAYRFRVRTYSDNSFGEYSLVATATTANYALRYVSPNGKDSNDGTRPDKSHAWLTLAHGSKTIQCGQELIVMGGSYAKDGIAMGQSCTAGNKAVVLVNPGDTAIITSGTLLNSSVIVLAGNYLVVDGMICASSTADPGGSFDALIFGKHNALLNVNISPAVIPTFLQSGLQIKGDHNLIYRSYLHDYGSPDAVQNPAGNGGYVLVLPDAGAHNNVIWSNHLTRGGHDVSLCLSGCSYNRWLNNIMDGGWGMAWNAVYAGAQNNLVEGNFVKDVGQLIIAYKPSLQVSQGPNTLRRNIVVNEKSAALEVSALYGHSAVTGSLIYNNVFYSPGSCYFQSHNQGVSAYDEVVFANNICYKFTGDATDIYLANKTNQIMYNDILSVDSDGSLQPDRAVIIWNHEQEGSYQYPRTLAYADREYNPPFSHNKGLDVNPQFVNEAKLDFHLKRNSRLIGAGTAIKDLVWGSTKGTIDLGAYGIRQISLNQ